VTISAAYEEIPGVLARSGSEQQQPGRVRQAPQQIQSLSGVPSRAVQQERQRRGSLRPVDDRHAQVAVARGAEHKRLQVDRRRPLHLCRTRPQSILRLHILACHRVPSIPAVLFGHTATLGPAEIFPGN
jgi:hypothetical protein